MSTALEVVSAKKHEIDDRFVGAAVAAELVWLGKEWGLALTGPDGLLRLFTKNVLETALNEELIEYLGQEKNRAGPDREGGSIGSGTRAKSVLTVARGEVWIEVRGDREGTFEPQIVKKRQRRLNGVEEIVLSLYANVLATGAISAHFAQICGASVSKETIFRITDEVIVEMNEWSARLLDEGRFLANEANLDQEDSRCHVGHGTRVRARPSGATLS
jgi:putative transposase